MDEEEDEEDEEEEEEENGVPCQAVLPAICCPWHHELTPAAMSPAQRDRPPPLSAQSHRRRCAKSPCRSFLLGSRSREEPVARVAKKSGSLLDFGLAAPGLRAAVASLTSAHHADTQRWWVCAGTAAGDPHPAGDPCPARDPFPPVLLPPVT